MKSSATVIKIGLASLFFVSLADMPYGYYQFVRLAALAGFAILAFIAYQKESPVETLIYGGLALLFQPFFKIALGRDLWNIVDIVVGVGLVISIFVNKNKNV